MSNKEIIQMVEGRKIQIFLPSGYDLSEKYSTVYINSDEKSTAFLLSSFDFSTFPFITILIDSEDRLADYTPWPAPSLDTRFPDFSGKADLYLKWITDVLLPYISQNYSTKNSPNSRALVGYSLAGLFDLYALCKTEFFGTITALSPSVWYENFTEYFKENLLNTPKTVMIVGGEDEGKGKKNLLQYAGRDILLVKTIIESRSEIQLTFELDQYGHHQNVKQRYESVFDFLVKNLS